MELDKLDRNILNILQTRADIPLKELAAQVQSSIATCQRRIKNLTEQGVIIRQAAIVSPQAVGAFNVKPRWPLSDIVKQG